MPFTIEATLNASNTTHVYRAFDETLRRRVLLKVLHKHLTNDEQTRQRFIREARACAALKSPYIAQVFDLTEVDGAPAIVMEYIEGKSLKEVIAESSQRTFALTSKVALHVLLGLGEAHKKRIIHRDIKPGNILVADEGVVKVTDFGLAHVTIAPTVTTEGTLVGTPAYIAPEQIRGELPDARGDFFSLGATLIETLSGERLFEGETYTECLNKVIAFRGESLDQFIPISSSEFVDFVKHLMHPDKNQRFGSAEEALGVLQHERPSIQLPLKQSSRKWIWTALAVITLAVILSAVYGITSLFHKSDTKSLAPLTIQGNPDLSRDTVTQSSISKQPQLLKGKMTRKGGRGGKLLADTRKGISTDSGSIKITSRPWATVYVDNRLIGLTPLDAPLRLSSGVHTVVFSHPSFDPVVKTITVRKNEQVPVHCDFLKNAGFLYCAAKPWAEIFVDEVYRETTPLDKAIMLSAGKHRVRFHNPSFEDIYRNIVIHARDTLKLMVSFPR